MIFPGCIIQNPCEGNDMRGIQTNHPQPNGWFLGASKGQGHHRKKEIGKTRGHGHNSNTLTLKRGKAIQQDGSLHDGNRSG